MSYGFLRQVVACALAIAVPAVTAAETFTATAVGSARATVNSSLLRPNQIIRDGDRLETARQSGMAIVGPDSSITLAENTSAIYSAAGLKVAAGVVQVSTKNGLGAEYKNLTVRPVSKEQSQYEIGELNGISTVAALHGALLVSDGTHSIMLPEGRSLQQEPVPAASGASGETKNKKKSDKENRRGGAVAVSGGLPGWLQVAILGGAIAGTLGGLGLAGYFDKKAVSPAVP